MNKKTRKQIADRIATTATEHGATCHIVDYPRGMTGTSARGYAVINVDFGEVKMSTEVGDVLAPAILAHFFDAKRDLSGVGMDSINTVHRRKGTLSGDNPDHFMTKFRRCCALIATGGAFLDGGEHVQN